jgi:hypothetical protein
MSSQIEERYLLNMNQLSMHQQKIRTLRKANRKLRSERDKFEWLAKDLAMTLQKQKIDIDYLKKRVKFWKNAAQAPLKEQQEAEIKLGTWLSAALSDDKVCKEMKDDINQWMSFFCEKNREHTQDADRSNASKT